jgi:hypothetical protein
MRPRAEEEPGEPEEPEQEPSAPAAATLIPTVGGAPPPEFQFRTEVLTGQQIADRKTLAELLGKESKDGWNLVDIIEADGSFTVLLRKPKDAERTHRPVGFTFRN